MKKHLLLLLLLCSLMGYSQSTFKRLYDDAGFAMLQLANDDFLVAGMTNESTTIGAMGVFLMRTNIYGDTLWTRKFGSNINAESVNSIQQTQDGGFILAGTSESFGTGFEPDVYLIRTDSTGSLIWSRIFGGSTYDYGTCVKQCSDGGYIVSGFTESFGAGNEDVYLIKTDLNGDPEWTRTYGGAFDDRGYYVEQTSANGFIIAGLTSSFGAGQDDILLIRTDSSGNVMWSKTLGGSGREDAYSVKQTTDGGFAVVGRSGSFGASRACLIKLDSSGTVVWSTLYNNTSDSKDVKLTSDGGFILTGSGTLLLRTDSLGNSIWGKKYEIGPAFYCYGKEVVETNDGGFAVLGDWEPITLVAPQIYFIKTDSLGNVGCGESTITLNDTSVVFITSSPALSISSGGFNIIPTTATSYGHGADSIICSGTIGINEPLEESSFSVFPNPFSSTLTIEFKDIQKGTIRVLDILGKEHRSFSFSGNTVSIEKGNLTQGIYFLQVITEGNVAQTQKIIVQ